MIRIAVSIHAPTRGATRMLPRLILPCIGFQSTHLREVRRVYHFAYIPSKDGFNPRTYERCDSPPGLYLHIPSVSIHAPTRGATSYPYGETNCFLVSIHAPTRGATQRACVKWFRLSHSFNPRTYERCDFLSRQISQRPQGFNPRTYERCDFLSLVCSNSAKCFNPRTYERCDTLDAQSILTMQAVSIHAPTRGATQPYHLRD